MEKNLDTTKPRYSEHILPVSWSFVISRFHCNRIVDMWNSLPFKVDQCSVVQVQAFGQWGRSNERAGDEGDPAPRSTESPG